MKTRINELKKGQDEAAETKEAIQKSLDKINADRNAIWAQIVELRT